jgi:hypothetical protein
MRTKTIDKNESNARAECIPKSHALFIKPTHPPVNSSMHPTITHNATKTPTHRSLWHSTKHFVSSISEATQIFHFF